MAIAFIHIGKTGGTTIRAVLENKLTNFKEYHMTNSYNPNEKYIIWIRNPIHRFVSAFNHSYYGVNIDIKSIKQFNLENCLLPQTMKNSIKKPYVFSKEYDLLIKQFTNANHLAESLTSADVSLKAKAIELMNRKEEHLYKGLHWYLQANNFLNENHYNILFVGRLEFMKEDIRKLSNILEVDLDENIKLRENIYLDKSMKYLSPLAIKNIIDWYKDTDYAVLTKLAADGWITETNLNMYYNYE